MCIGTLQDRKALWVYMQNIFQSTLHRTICRLHTAMTLGSTTFKYTFKSAMFDIVTRHARRYGFRQDELDPRCLAVLEWINVQFFRQRLLKYLYASMET